jgi:catechol 2,3-dioxygenase-like lactoylglutathione lyase family enzyme
MVGSNGGANPADEPPSAFARPTLHHIALTVTSFERSLPWYEALFQIRFRNDAPHEGGVGKLLADDDWSLVIVLHEHEANDGGEFSERVTGLDHVAFGVGSREDLERWTDRLEHLGVRKVAIANRPLTQSPIVDSPPWGILVFRDPDNIQLEFFSSSASSA